ncbi:MAG TPA: uracil-DNA glycosylase family protein [Pyrinomonadaceae bacterium]|nr:uracil-DNA glycosylase family protein [Pyrinomonadaceae bacterium]
MNPKALYYAKLVAERKRCSACTDLVNISKFKALDSDHIGAYSRWQGNLDSELVVIGQDSADVNTFKTVGGGWPGEAIQTNLAVVELVKAAGIKIAAPRYGLADNRLFFTNAVLCLKKGPMQQPVPSPYFRNCADRFLRRTIELVQPRAVVTLGKDALKATLYAFGLRYPGNFLALVDTGCTFDLSCGARLFPMCHPTPTVLNTHRSLEKQKADWKRFGRWLKRHKALQLTAR